MVEVYIILLLKQTYKLQTVPQMGKMVHFDKRLEFPVFKAGGSVKTVSLKLNGFNGFRNKL